MVQGKIKKIKKTKTQNYYAKKRKERHEKHHLSHPKIQKIPENSNDPNIKSRIKNISIQNNIKKQINNHQKKIYKSIEEKIIEKAKKNNETLDLL